MTLIERVKNNPHNYALMPHDRREWMKKQITFPWLQSEYKLVYYEHPPVSGSVAIPPTDGTRFFNDGNWEAVGNGTDY